MALFDSIRLGASNVSEDFEIERSLRFNDDDSAYLNRTPSSTGNRRTWTYSVWLKLGNIGFVRHIFTKGSVLASPWVFTYFDSDNRFKVWFLDGASYYSQSQPIFRDPTAWYHFVLRCDTTQSTASNRLRFYVNGALQSWSSYQAPAQNFQTAFNTTNQHVIGRQDQPGQYFDGYMAEFNHIDGQSLDPSSFAETNSETGGWVPINTSGLNFGTNGFRLKFSDNSGTSATTLGKDSSGNGNNWTPNNFSVSTWPANDSVEDTPSNNFATLNILDKHANVNTSNGNLETASTTGGNHFPIFTAMSMRGGKYYMEYKCLNNDNGMIMSIMNIEHDGGSLNTDSTPGNNTSAVNKVGFGLLVGSGRTSHNGTLSSPGAYGSALAVNQAETGMCAVDLDNGKIWWGKQGTFFNSGDPANGTNAAFTTIDTDTTWSFCFHVLNNNNLALNWGQHGFTYTPPTGFSSLSTKNLADPNIKISNENFNTVTYSGNNGTQSISGVGFQPDFVWIKSKGGSYASDHNLMDAVRGLKKVSSASVLVESNFSHRFNSFDSDGFTVQHSGGGGGFTNGGSQSYVAWNWNGGGTTVTNTNGSLTSSVRANPSAGISIVTYTGAGGGRTVGHGLGVAPKAIWVKSRSYQDHWAVYHHNVGNTKIIYLNLANSPATSSGYWNNTTPTSSVFSIGSDNKTGRSGTTYVAYVFSEVVGFSKFGKYVGNSNASNGTFVFCGFRPALVIFKKITGSDNWEMKDNKRDLDNPVDRSLFPNLTSNESTGRNVDFLSNGFKHYNANGNTNENGHTYVFFAFAENPLNYSRAR